MELTIALLFLWLILYLLWKGFGRFVDWVNANAPDATPPPDIAALYNRKKK